MIKLNFNSLDVNSKKSNNNSELTNINLNLVITDNFTKLVNYIKQLNKIESNAKNKKINLFRIKHLNYAISVFSNLDYKITKDNVKLINIPGIGKGSIVRINEILDTDTLSEFNDLEKQLFIHNKNINIIKELNDIIGIGDIKAIELINNFNISSIQDLIDKVNSNKIIVNDKIKLGLKYYGKYKINIPRDEINLIYLFMDNIINLYDNQFIMLFCGSFRRDKPFCNDIDVLLLHPNLFFQDDVNDSNYLYNIVNLFKQNNFLIDDLTNSNHSNSSLINQGGKTKYMGFCKLPSKSNNYDIRRIDIRMIGMESYATAIMYFTGSYEFNRIMRNNAKKLGYKLNEYGLYDNHTNQKITIINELSLFNILKMEYLDPAKRDL